MDDTTTVFGGTGVLGSVIVQRIVAAGRPVRIAARHPGRPAWAEDGAAIELATADVHDEASVARALKGAGAAVNAVSLYTESGGNDAFDAVHVAGAGRVARLAQDAGSCRFQASALIRPRLPPMFAPVPVVSRACGRVSRMPSS